MRFVAFASGSGGNCALLQGGGVSVLLDAGISLRRIRAGLAAHGLTVGELDAVFITHEHTDHVGALGSIVKYYPVPVYASRAAARRLSGTVPGLEALLRPLRTGEPTALGALSVTAFPTSHDTEESVGYRFDSPEGRFGVCTDTGVVTDEMLAAMAGCNAALIEANHDLVMLRNGRYPYPLKRRILSDRGHLSNDACAAFACALARSGTRQIVLGHLSRENNTPGRAMETVREALDADGWTDVVLAVAPQDGEVCVEVTACSVSS